MAKENKYQRKIQALITYYCKTLSEDPQDGTVFDCDVIRALEELRNQYADHPATNFKMDNELKELGFLEPGTIGTCGCITIPCFGGKMPDQKLPEVPCAIIRSMCDMSPRQSMRDTIAFKKIEAKLKEQKRLAKNKAARDRYHRNKKNKDLWRDML